MTDDATKLTENYVVEKATEILEEARRLGYFMFRSRVQAGGFLPTILSFANRGTTRDVRQLGWAQFYTKCGGQLAGPDQARRSPRAVQSLILSADRIEPW